MSRKRSSTMCRSRRRFTPCLGKNIAMTLIDTPGYAAFLADSINSMRAFGGAVFVLNPAVGLRVESERLWARANEDGVSRLLFVTKMDHEQANVEQRIAPMLETLEAKGVYLQMPIGAEAEFQRRRRSAVDEGVSLRRRLGQVYRSGDSRGSEGALPTSGAQKMVEDVSETDDELLEKFLDGKELSHGRNKKSDPRGHPGAKDFSDSCSARRCAKSASRNCSMRSSTICRRRSMRAKSKGSNPANGETIKRAAGSQRAVFGLCVQNRDRSVRRQAFDHARACRAKSLRRDLLRAEPAGARKKSATCFASRAKSKKP